MSKLNFDMEAAMAEFAAKGGKVQVIAQDVRAIESDKTIYLAMRNGTRAKADATVSADSQEARYFARQEAFDSAKYDGQSDLTARTYADSVEG